MSFMGKITAWAGKWLPFFWKREVRTLVSDEPLPIPPTIAPEPIIPVPQKPARRPRKQAEDNGLYQGFEFRRDVLDQLDAYFYYIKRMKKGDPDAYALYSKIGAYATGGDLYVDQEGKIGAKLLPWWKHNRPGFGAISTKVIADIDAEEKTSNFIVPKFYYFRKMALPSAEIQPVLDGGDVYQITVYWDAKSDKKMGNRGAPTEYAVLITKDAEVKLLKTRVSDHIVFGKGHKRASITRDVWGHHSFFRIWAAHHKRPISEYLVDIFVSVANQFTTETHSMVEIRAIKKDCIAVFSVDVLRTPYFFKDRDTEVGATGRRKKIFHIVRTHMRTNAQGVGTFVKTHFRGERKFQWNGYEIEISVPFREHTSFSAFDIGALDKESAAEAGHNVKKLVGNQYLAKALLTRRNRELGERLH